MKEKALLKRVVALICCVAMLTTALVLTVFAAPSGKAKVTLKYDGDIIFISDLNDPLNPAGGITEGEEPTGQVYYAEAGAASGTIVLVGWNGEDEITLAGKTIVFYASTDETYKVEAVCAAGANTDVKASDKYSVDEGKALWEITVQPAKTCTVTISLAAAPEPEKYDIVYEDSDLYTIEGLPEGEKVVHGGSVSFTVNPISGYKVLSVKVNSKMIKPDADGNYKVSNVTEDLGIEVSVSKANYKITYSAMGDGVAYTLKQGVATANYGDAYSFTIDTTPGYDAPMVLVGESKIQPSGNVYTITITSDTEIVIIAGESKQYTVTAVYNSACTIDVSQTSVNYNDTVTFNVKPKQGYEVSVVRVNGRAMSIVESGEYTISNVTEDLEIEVTVSKANCTIKYELDENKNTAYTLPLVEELSLEYGSTYSFSISPMAGYDAPMVTVNGTEIQPSGNLYTITITGETVIKVVAGGEQTFSVSVINGEGYSIKVDPTSVKFNQSATVTVTVYKLYSAPELKIMVDGKEVAGGAVAGGETFTYEITNITADVTVSVSGVVKNTYSVTLVPGKGYTLTASNSSTTLSAGDIFKFTVAVAEDEGYTGTPIVYSNGSAIDADENGVYSVEVTENITITVDEVALKTFEARIEAPNADVKFDEGTNIIYGGTYEFTVTAKPGYSVVRVVNNGVELLSANGVYTIQNVTSVPVIRVETKENTLTVNYVSTLKNHEYSSTQTFTYTEITAKWYVELDTHAYHKFEGWKHNDVVVDAGYMMNLISESDNEVTLTAIFEVDKDALKELLTLDPTIVSLSAGNGRYTYVATYKTYARVLDEALNDPCVADYVKVTAYGTLFTNNIDAFNVTDLAAILSDRPAEEKYGMRLDISDYTVFNYYHECEMSLASIDDKYVPLQMNVNGLDGFYAAGWMELTINGQSVIIISKPFDPASAQ